MALALAAVSAARTYGSKRKQPPPTTMALGLKTLTCSAIMCPNALPALSTSAIEATSPLAMASASSSPVSKAERRTMQSNSAADVYFLLKQAYFFF